MDDVEGHREVRPLRPRRLSLRFEDGVEGELDFAEFLEFRGVFEALRDPQMFAEVRVVPEWGTIAWSNGADLDPDVLYARVTGIPIAGPDDAGEADEREPAA